MRWLKESEGFSMALSSPGQVPCAISHRNMVIHPEFNAASPPRNCSRHHRQSWQQASAQGDVSAQPRQGSGSGKSWGGSAQFTSLHGAEMGKVSVGHCPSLVVLYTRTTQTRYAASSKMQHLVQLWSVWRLYLQENFGDKKASRALWTTCKAGQKLLPFWPLCLGTWFHCQ